MAKFKRVIIAKIDIGAAKGDEIRKIMNVAKTEFKADELEKDGCLTFLIPVRDEKTSLTFVDLKTMQKVTT